MATTPMLSLKGIAGIYSFDSGDIVFEGAPVHIPSPKQASALGIEVVYQDLALCDNLDIVLHKHTTPSVRG
jgi:D-xylose transport system ATP-binding protein